MSWNLDNTKWLLDTGVKLKTSDGISVTLLDFKPELIKTELTSEWATHFRNHYCLDTEIDLLRNGTGLSRKDYLLNLKFPSTSGFGPGIRAGDFGEILIADYLEFTLKYWVPRTRYGTKTIRDESSKGSDIIGFKTFDENETEKDILAQIEVKAQFSGSSPNPRLQDAVNDSVKDDLRKGESLNAMKQRMLDKGMIAEATKVSRFQNPTDKPYTTKYGAAALFSNANFDDSVIQTCDTSGHPNKSDLFMIVVKGEDLMKVVTNLYNIAADES
jgi:hypothetical protein